MKKVLLALFALFLCTLTHAAEWYYVDGAAKVSSKSPTGAGLVYVTHTDAGTTYDGLKGDEKWSTTVRDTAQGEENERYDYYFYAQPAEGFIFQGWSETDGGTELGTDNPLKITITADKVNDYVTRVLYAHFAEQTHNEITLIASKGGTCCITDGTTTVTGEGTLATDEFVTLSATPDAGLKVLAWYILHTDGTREYFAYSATTRYHFSGNCTIGVEFVDSKTPAFVIKGHRETPFLNLKDALQAAKGQGTIVLVSDGEVGAGEYTVPAGVTLLIPFDDLFTAYTNTPDVEGRPLGDIKDYTIPTPYRTLTLGTGAHLIVEGVISISARQASLSASLAGSQTAGGVVGPYGSIHLLQGSSIDLRSGSSLYAWGFITGPGVTNKNQQSGTIMARCGAAVWESFQIASWRGGTATTAMADSVRYRVLPFNQYYIQNIECPITFQAGATETLCTSVYMGDGSSNSAPKPYAGSFRFISSEPALFTLTDGEITKQYDGTTDRLTLSISGTVSVDDMSLSLGDFLVSTQQFNFPVTGNLQLDILSGTTTLSQDMELLPGASVNIHPDATLQVADTRSLYVYDADEWGKYACVDRSIMPLLPSNVPSVVHDRQNDALPDASIVVGGTLVVNGQLYTTGNGAAITGTDGGSIQMSATTGVPTLYEVTQQGVTPTYYAIPTTAAQLLQGNGSYLSTEPSEQYIYTTSGAYGRWYAQSTGDGITFPTDNNEDNTFYDLSGRRIQHITRPGIYLHGGKKIFSK